MNRELPPVALFDNYWAPTLAFAYSLGRRGVPLHVYGSGAARRSRFATRCLPCPDPDDFEEFQRWLRERLATGEIARIAPTTDLIAYHASVLRDAFEPTVRRAILPQAEIETCLFKDRFAGACTGIGQPVPASAAPCDLRGALSAAKALGYPLLLKPKSHLVVGTSNRGRIVTNDADLSEAFARMPVEPGHRSLADRYPELCWPLMQRYLPDAGRRVYSVSGVIDAEHGILAETLSCKREQWPPSVGISTAQEWIDDARVLSAGLATVGKQVSCGIFELELLADGNELLAIDLNPRAYGFIMLDIALGKDVPWLWYRTTLAAVPRAEAPPPSGALECRFVLPYYLARAVEAAFLGRARRAGGADRAWVSMLGHRSDPIPMLLSHLRLLRHPRSLIWPHIEAARRTRKQGDVG